VDLFLIDAIGPFFRGVKGRKVNWSKIPFHRLEVGGDERERRFHRLREDLAIFADRVAAEGWNAVSLDDLAHLADHERYEPEVRTTIDGLRGEFRRLFSLLRQRGLSVFLTMDVMTYTPALRRAIGNDQNKVRVFLSELIDRFFADFPEVAGLIVRIGESDGKDVPGELSSELVLRTTAQVNRLLRDLLPVFERHGRLLIFRTWTVGAYDIGDLIWHRGTFAKVLDGIDSHAFVLSMKFGETDFFRYLPLNRNFFRTEHNKIVELQTRREYEGCGEFPSFIGWDYEGYARELAQARNLIGISVWCQTGGWVPFRRLAYLPGGEGLWTELNTFVTLRIFRDGMLVEEAVQAYATREGISSWVPLLELLRLSDRAVKELLYVREFAQQQLFFRRVRIPPLVSVVWNNIFISHSVRKILRHFVLDGERCIREGYTALARTERMVELAAQCGLPEADLRFMRDTFEILALAREYYFRPYSGEIRLRLEQAKRRYKELYPKGGRPRYRVKLDFDRFRLGSRELGWLLQLTTRRRRGYRLIDRVLMLHVLSVLYRLVRRASPRWIPKFARKAAMGIDVVFR
jgi:hypothetical protein